MGIDSRINLFKAMISVQTPGLTLTLLLTQLAIFGQNLPLILDFNPKEGPIEAKITISGKNLPTDTANSSFYLDGIKADLVDRTLTSDQVQIIVPAGVNYGPITIIDEARSLSVISKKNFKLNYSGDSLEASRFKDDITSDDVSPASSTSLCGCDLDQDGDAEVILVDRSGRRIIVYENQNQPDNIDFKAKKITFANGVKHSICADVDNNGSQEIVLTTTSNIFYIVFNALGSHAIRSYAVPNLKNENNDRREKLVKAQAADLNEDGLTDLIFSSLDNNELLVYNNQGGADLNSIFDPTQVFFAVANNSEANLSGLVVVDLNDDDKPEIVTSPFREQNGVFIFDYQYPNNSNDTLVGNQFLVETQNNSPLEICHGDFDNDGDEDIVTSFSGTNVLEVLKNNTQSFDADIKFERLQNPITLLDRMSPFGLDVGDMNGDGLLDIIAFDDSDERLVILQNITSGGNIRFQPIELKTQSGASYFEIIDVDNDGRPDIVYPDQVNRGVSILRNTNCINPFITFIGDLSAICKGNPKRIFATQSFGNQYIWKKDGSNFRSSSDNFVDIEDSGVYTLDLTTNEGCSQSIPSDQSITVKPNENAPSPPTIQGNTSICQGEVLFLEVTSEAGFTYQWFDDLGNVVESSNQITVDSATVDNNGTYYAIRKDENNGCESTPDTAYVVIRLNPSPLIKTNDTIFCEDDSLLLSFEINNDYDYQWFRDGKNLNNTSDQQYADQSGKYYFSISDRTADPCVTSSEVIQLQSVNKPNSSFDIEDLESNALDSICIDIEVLYRSSSQDQSNLSFSWDFGDGTNSSESTPEHAYSSSGQYNVELTSRITNVDNCSSNSSRTFKVVSPPAAQLVVETNNGDSLLQAPYQKCPEDSLILRFITGLDGYNWSTGDSVNLIKTSQVGSYRVAGTNGVQCVLRDTVTIENYPESGIFIRTDESTYRTVEEGVLTLQSSDAESIVTLQATNGLDSTYRWSSSNVSFGNLSNDQFSNQLGTETEFFLKSTFDTVYLTGLDTRECQASDTLIVRDERTRAQRVFKPGDPQFGCWEITNISSLGNRNCTLYIFDNKGKNIVVKSITRDQEDCLWTGDSSGQLVEEGVYFYVLKCDTEPNRTGSILLVR